MTVSGLPRPLPECRRCGAPLPRAVWRTRRSCSECATTAELMAAAHTRAELDRVTEATNRKVNARIDQLAAQAGRTCGEGAVVTRGASHGVALPSRAVQCQSCQLAPAGRDWP